MRIRVLGCSGGIGGSLRTTALLVDDDILVDAGTGVGDLPLESLAKIDHIFVSHSHLDHVTSIPFLVDTVCWMRGSPVTVYGTRDTLDILRAHIFNWKVWPDFTQIPDSDHPFMAYREIEVGEAVEIGGRRITAIPANHTVPALGFHIFNERAALVFSGDTGPNDQFWRIVNSVENLRYLIIETAFPNRDQDLAVTSRHLYPIQLGQELEKLKREPQVLVTHLKPSDRKVIERELDAWAGRFAPRVLERGDVFEL